MPNTSIAKIKNFQLMQHFEKTHITLTAKKTLNKNIFKKWVRKVQREQIVH